MKNISCIAIYTYSLSSLSSSESCGMRFVANGVQHDAFVTNGGATSILKNDAIDLVAAAVSGLTMPEGVSLRPATVVVNSLKHLIVIIEYDSDLISSLYCVGKGTYDKVGDILPSFVPSLYSEAAAVKAEYDALIATAPAASATSALIAAAAELITQTTSMADSANALVAGVATLNENLTAPVSIEGGSSSDNGASALGSIAGLLTGMAITTNSRKSQSREAPDAFSEERIAL